MKIGYYVQHFPYIKYFDDVKYFKQYRWGGSEIAAYYLAINMAKRGHEVHIFTTSLDHQDHLEKYGNIYVHRYGRSFRVGEYNISCGLFYKPFKQQVDVIHAHLSVKIDGLAGLLYVKRKKIPFVVTHHSDTNVYSGLIHRTRLVYFLNSHITKKCFSHANVIISPSERYINESRFLGSYRDKVIVIPNGININEFDIGHSKEECRVRLSLPLDEKIILFLGALTKYKGPDILLKAMSMVVREIPNIKLIFVGDGRMKKELEDLSDRLGIKKNVKFAGFAGRNLTPLYYKATDIFCLPSKTESFGIVNLEAMACGVPVVASRIGGITDVVKDGKTGLLVPPKNPEKLAAAILSLLNDEKLRERISKNAKKYVEKYGWDVIAKKHDKLYSDLIGVNK